MLNKGKKPEPKEEVNPAHVPAAPLRPETPKLLRAALEMAEKSSGLKGALSKFKEKYSKSSVSLQVPQIQYGRVTATRKRMSTVWWINVFLSPPALPLLLPASSVPHLQFRIRQRCRLAIARLHLLCSAPLRLPSPRQQRLRGASLCIQGLR